MIRLQVPQFSTAKWFPYSLKNLVREFLDHIVNMVKANRPFLPLLTKDPESPVVLFAPDVGGSSALLMDDIKEKWPQRKILMMDSSSTPKPRATLLSINHAHQLDDKKFVELLEKLQGQFSHLIIGEGNNKSLRQVIGMTLIVPVVILLTTPWIKPFRWSRLFWTYLVPILPLIIVWDGVAALFRIRSPELCLRLAQQSSVPGWEWQAGKLPNGRGGFIIYLIGSQKTEG